MHRHDIGTEKRRAHRVRVHLSAQYRSDAVSLDGMVRDLSCDGMFLRSELLDTSGSTVSLEVRLPDGRAVHVDGEVVRVVDAPAGSGMAIRFVQVALSVRRQLANYMLLQSSRNRAR